MIPLFHDALVDHYKLITAESFGNIVAIAQMTPGPIGINAATYIGYMHGGLIGATLGTFGLLTPSLIIISIVAHFAEKFKHSNGVKGALTGIRPAVIGLIAAAVLFFAEMSIFTGKIPFDYILAKLSRTVEKTPSFGIQWQGVVIFLAALTLSGKYKVNVIWTIVISAVLGMILFSF